MRGPVPNRGRAGTGTRLTTVQIVERADLERIRAGLIPRHVGCIMDGNGRWAQMRVVDRSEGHRNAEPAVYEAVDAALELGIEWFTVYAFSTENWRRSDAEIAFLMSFQEWLLHESRLDELHEKNVRVLFVGEIDDERIPADSRTWLRDAMARTAGNTRMTFAIAFNYGGQFEILRAATAIRDAGGTGMVTEAEFTAAMYEPDMPPMDLLVRTSGEERTSNFFPWHAAYAEFVFMDTLWPDFRGWHLYSAVDEYQRRNRRQGAATIADDLG